MSGYYWILVWMAAFAFLSSAIDVQRQEIVCEQNVYRYNWGWAIVGLIPLLYLCTVRGNVGDTASYTRAFNGMPEALGDFSSYMNNITKDRGFYAFSAFIKIVIGPNVKMYFFILALIQVLLLIKVYRKYSTQYVVSIFLFLVSTDYISWMYNGIRQFLAVTITFACCSLIIRKKYILVIILTLIAATIHGTALLVIPFIFIVHGKAWNKKTVLFVMIAIMAVAFIDQFTNILDSLLHETQYGNVVSDWQSWQDDGTNVLRVLAYSVPTILSLIGLKFIQDADDPIINLCTNMSIISMGFYVVSMFTSGIFVGRLPIYFSLYNYILLPWEIENIFTKSLSRVIYLCMVSAYLLFYVYSLSTLGL